MSELKIAVRESAALFQPGGEISGAAQWKLKRAPESMEARLLWRISGRCRAESHIAWTVSFENPLQDDTRPFTLTAPSAPRSFSSKLVTLQWTLELVALPSKENAHVDIVIGLDV